ncbi:MAG: GNAT family N-acetyltransferase [Acidobacteriota bacterium]|nr:MAG: GNAT family N-acetyltransferase [Acidobacteriota bacterium]
MNMPISTERLEIRQLRPGDLPKFIECMTDPGSTRYLQFEEEQKTKKGAAGLSEAVLASFRSDGPVHSYAIVEEESGEFVGSCGYAPYSGGIVEVCCTVNRERTGRGFATEAARALAEILGEEFEVRAYWDPGNVAAHRVALRAGFEDKGIPAHEVFGNEGRLFVFKG